MEQVLQYIRSNEYFGLWKRREWNEIIEGVYTRLGLAIRQGCDTVAVHPGGVLLFREGQSAEPFPVRLFDPAFYVVHKRDMMRIIRRRDPLIRKHFRLAHEDQERAIYRLTPSGEPPSDPALAELDRRDAEEAPIDRLIVPLSPPASTPRESWGLRDRPIAPYDYASLLRAHHESNDLLIAHGVAYGLRWSARAEPTLTHGIEEAQAECITSGWPPEELLEHAQFKLETAQAALEAGETTPLWLSHREPIDPGAPQTSIYLKGPGFPPMGYRILSDWIYQALVANGDQLRMMWKSTDAADRNGDVLVIRAGTVMAVLSAGSTGGRNWSQ